MKHHGRYELLTPEELGLNAAYYDEEGKVKEFIHNQLNRHRQKHRNDKRHKQKLKKKKQKMTDERKNEIWAMLTQSEQKDIRFKYACTSHSAKYDKGYNEALEMLFGYDNLTAQAEEKPKEPRFKAGDKVFYDGLVYEIECRTGKFHYALKGRKHDVVEDVLMPYPIDNGKSDGKSEVYENSVHLNPPKSVGLDYAQYRLDLAKEIAVAVIRSDRWDFHSCNPVEQANEIVKRLKETEE